MTELENMEDTNPLISIIILNYNAGKLLIDCIESVLKSNYKKIEIILVDNNSKDGSHEICKDRFKEIILIRNKENFGYCEGNNIGIRKAKGEFIVVLNPDTLVESEWLDELVLAYEKNGDGLYQPKFLTTCNHKIIMSTGNMIQLFGFGFSRGKGNIDEKHFEKIEKIGYASGTCLFTSKKILEKLDLFDSFLFAYHDDLDLGWRGAMRGISSFYVPKAIVYHPPEGFSFKWDSFKYYLLERNRIYCILTHYSHSTFFKMIPALILVDLAVTIFYIKRGMLNSKIKANYSILKNLKIINKRYNVIQKKRIVSDKNVIIQFEDEIMVPNQVANKKSNKKINNFIKKLSQITRKQI